MTMTQDPTPDTEDGRKLSRRQGRAGVSVLQDGPRHRDPIKPVPFSRVVHVETRKQLDTVAGRWFLIGIAAVTALVFAIMLFVNGGDHPWMQYLGGATTPLSVLLPIIGIMAATSEWSQRTAMTTFTLEPRRGRTVAAKVLSSLFLGVVLFAVAVALSAVVHQIAITGRGIDGDWTIGWWTIGGAAIVLLISMLQGSAFGLALLNTPAAIVAFFAAPIAVSGLSVLLPSWDTFFSWVDLNRTLGPLFAGMAPTGTEWAHITVAVAIWVALPMAIGVWRVLHREVK
ncbi:MAG: ABC transporter permease [Ornithinimicrobium sp.]